jgi:hypothetical protein
VTDPFQIKVWAQMFFDDGSVSEGIRIPATVFDDDLGDLQQIAVKLLNSVNRQEGFLVVWGAGNLFYRLYILETNACLLEESDS